MARRKQVTKPRNSEHMVFTPKRYTVTIGENDYTIEPQPIKRVVEFDGMVDITLNSLGDFGQRHYVVKYKVGDDGQEEVISRDGPLYDDQAQELLGQANGSLARIESDPIELSGILNAIVAAPHAVLQIVIPDLEEEDCRELSVPELTWLTEILIEVNGLDWLRDVAKNLGGPLLQEIGAALADWMRLATWQSSLAQITDTDQDSTS